MQSDGKYTPVGEGSVQFGKPDKVYWGSTQGPQNVSFLVFVLISPGHLLANVLL
jgi:hypothetical protein